MSETLSIETFNKIQSIRATPLFYVAALHSTPQNVCENVITVLNESFCISQYNPNIFKSSFFALKRICGYQVYK